MAKIPRSESEVAPRGQPLPSSSGDGFEAPGKALASFGQAASTLAGEYQKEQDKEDSFQTRLRLMQFQNQQDLETIRRQNEQNGDPTGYTQQRVADYWTAAQDVLKTIPPKQQTWGRLIIESHGGSTAEQAARYEYGQRKVMLSTETAATLTGTFARIESADPETLDKALSLSDKIISDAPLPEAAKQQLRSHAASVAYARVIELAGPDARDVGQKIINDWSGRLSTPEAISRKGKVSIGASRGDGMVKVTTGSGAGFVVAQDYANRFQGALADLEAAGIKVKGEQSGGFNDRNIAGTSTKSQHAFGRAIDVNWDENGRGTKGAIPADLARSVAKKWGLKWGGDWRNPDPMHFEVDRSAKVTAQVADSGGGADQVASGEGGPLPGRFMPSAKSELVETFVKHMPQLNEIWLKRQEQINAANTVKGYLDGSIPFNPQDQKARKLVNDAFAATEVGQKLYAGDPVTLAQSVAASNALNYVPDPVADAIKGLVRQNDPDKKALGFQSAAGILAKQPYAFDAVEGGEKIRKEAQEFTGLTVERGKSTKEALATMAEWQTPEWQAKAETRKKAADDAVKALKGNEFQDSIQGWFEFEPTAAEVSGAAARLKSDYQTAFRDNFIRYGDADLANAVTKAETGRIWGRSEFLGRKEVMRYPFEKFYPPVGGKYDLYQKDLVDAVRQAAKDEVKPANIYLVPDERTQREIGTGKPTYGVSYVDKNGLIQTVPGARWPQSKNVEDVTGAFAREFERQRKAKLPEQAPAGGSNPIVTEPKDNPLAPHMLLREGAKTLWHKLTSPEPDPGPANTIPSP